MDRGQQFDLMRKDLKLNCHFFSYSYYRDTLVAICTPIEVISHTDQKDYIYVFVLLSAIWVAVLYL